MHQALGRNVGPRLCQRNLVAPLWTVREIFRRFLQMEKLDHA